MYRSKIDKKLGNTGTIEIELAARQREVCAKSDNRYSRQNIHKAAS